MSLFGAITIVLLVLKLLKLITISWWVVFAPRNSHIIRNNSLCYNSFIIK